LLDQSEKVVFVEPGKHLESNLVGYIEKPESYLSSHKN
jgi:hypothetical protein